MPSHLLTVIGPETTIKGGTVRVKHDLRIDGHVEADVEAGGRVILSAGASLRGRLVAPNVVVAGRLEGVAHIRERLYVKATAVVSGQIRAGRLVIEEGAQGDGYYHFTRNPHRLPAPPAPPEAAPAAPFSRASFALQGDGVLHDDGVLHNDAPDAAPPDTPGFYVNVVHARGRQAPDPDPR